MSRFHLLLASDFSYGKLSSILAEIKIIGLCCLYIGTSQYIWHLDYPQNLINETPKFSFN